jgi:type IV pilus assembly protein PilC
MSFLSNKNKIFDPNQNQDDMNLFEKLNFWFLAHSKIPLKEKIFFIQNLSTMLKAGLSLAQALEGLKQQTTNKRFAGIIHDICTRVDKGEKLSSSFKKYPNVFGHLFVSMVASGEESGNLENVLAQLHKQLKRSHELNSKVKGAMTYPIVILVALVGIFVAMIIFVIPKFVSIFDELGSELPVTTRVLINLSDFAQNNLILLVIILIVSVVGFTKAIRTKKGQEIKDNILIRLPVLAPIIKKINLTRFARTISSLIKTEIPIVKAFQITADNMGNLNYKNALLTAADSIQKGLSINEVLRGYPQLFPPTIIQMITVGEESGSVDDILLEIAEFYEEEVNQIMKNLPTIIEPVLMLVLGLAVGFMAVSILMPMYSMSNAF